MTQNSLSSICRKIPQAPLLYHAWMHIIYNSYIYTTCKQQASHISTDDHQYISGVYTLVSLYSSLRLTIPCTRADPTILVEADGQVDTQKALKALSFPVMDDDGLASSYAQRVLQAIAKWRVKMCSMVDQLDAIESDGSEALGPLLITSSW